MLKQIHCNMSLQCACFCVLHFTGHIHMSIFSDVELSRSICHVALAPFTQMCGCAHLSIDSCGCGRGHQNVWVRTPL